MVNHGFAQVAQSGKKTLDVLHFYSGDVKALDSFSLFKNLPTYANFDLSAKDKKKDDDAAEQPESADSATNMSFVTYVTNGINWLKSDKGVNITIGTRVKKYLSDLIIDFIRKLALITKALLKVINVRTIAPNHIKAVVNILLIEGNVSEQSSEELSLFIENKLELYRQEQASSKDTPAQPEATA